MAKSAGKIVISLSAGTAEFIAGIDKANARLTQFGRTAQSTGTHVTSSMAASSAAVRLFEGNLSIRAVERFLGETLKLGPALQKAFPIIGAVVFAGVLVETGKKVYEFFKAIQDAPEKIRGMFREATSSLRLTNDELKVTDDRLKNEIAKLEGKRQNNLALALDEAKVAADKLGQSLDQSMAKAVNLLKEADQAGWMQWFRHLQGGANVADFQKYLGGETGYGGQREALRQITDDGRSRLDALSPSDTKGRAAIEADTDAKILALKQKVLADLEVRVKANSKDTMEWGPNSPQAQHEKATLEVLAEARSQINELFRTAPLQRSVETDTRTLGQLQQNASNAKLDRPYDDAISKLQAEGSASLLKLLGAGSGDNALTQGLAKAAEVIADADEKLKHLNGTRDAAKEAEIRALAVQNATNEGLATYRKRTEEETRAIENRIKSQEMLTAAIGQGYEATRRASVETELMGQFKENYGNPDYQGGVSAMRGQLTSEYDARNAEQAATALQALNEHIALEKALLGVQMQGADAERAVTLQLQIQKLLRENNSADAQKLVAATKNLSDLEEKIRLTKLAVKAAIDPAQHLQDLDKELDILEKIKAQSSNSLLVEVAMRDVQRQRLDVITQMNLATNTLNGGLAAFFTQMQVPANPGKILFDGLNQGLDDVSHNFTQLATGGKTQWGKNFQTLGRGMADQGIKGILQMALGGLGKKVGVSGALGSTEASAMWVQLARKGTGGISTSGDSGAPRNPFSGFGGAGGAVGNDNGTQLYNADSGDPDGVADAMDGVLQSGPGFWSTLYKDMGGSKGMTGLLTGLLGVIPGLADGGDVSGAYTLVGERGPELLRSGHVYNNAESRRIMAGGGDTHNYYVDARGTDPVLVEMRVKKAVVAAHNSAVSNAVQAQQERSRRVPPGR